MSRGYVTIYDTTEASFGDTWTPVIFGVVYVAFAVALWFKRESMMPNRSETGRIVVAAFNIWLAVAWTILAAWRVGSAEIAIKAAMRDGTMQKTEGFVRDYKPHFAGGDFQERWCVNQACFHYFDWLPGPGYHATGMIETGMQVRLFYVGNNILLLDIVPVPKHQPPAGPPPGVGME